MAMRWSLRRLADAAEAIAGALSGTEAQNAESAKVMEGMLANQARMVQQNDEIAQRNSAMDAEGKRHRENCEEYHKKFLAQATILGEEWRQQFAALEARVIGLEKKTEEPWK